MSSERLPRRDEEDDEAAGDEAAGDEAAGDEAAGDEAAGDEAVATPPGDSADRLDQLIVAYVADVAAYCRWRCASEEDAQDAVSEVFLVAWRRLGDVPEGDNARVWLLATARRVIANERRARGRRHRLVERLRLFEPPDPVVFPVELVAGEVGDALRQLNPADREILLLAEWEGLTSNEIGAVMGCLAVTARGRLHRARQRFRTVYAAGQSAAAPMPPPRPAVTAVPPRGAVRRSGR